MSKRSNLPYTTQDLFPQVPPTPGSLRTRPGSITGSIASGNSATFEVPQNVFFSSSQSTIRSLKKMFKRVFKPNTLDFETAMWEIFNLIINPKKMYRSQYYKQSTNGKNSYSRDDPSFLILLTLFLSITAIAWGFAYSPHLFDIFKLIIYMVFIDFYLTGILISTVSWLLTNRIFNKTWGSNKYSVNYIEWGFCFDIHCNSFLMIWCLLYLLQFILLPLITIKNSFFSLLLGNSLYFISLGYYFIITFYGFNSLPIVSNQLNGSKNLIDNPSRLLQMIIIAGILPILALGWILTLLLRVNVAYSMIDTYFN